VEVYVNCKDKHGDSAKLFLAELSPDIDRDQLRDTYGPGDYELHAHERNGDLVLAVVSVSIAPDPRRPIAPWTTTSLGVRAGRLRDETHAVRVLSERIKDLEAVAQTACHALVSPSAHLRESVAVLLGITLRKSREKSTMPTGRSR